MTLTYWFRDYAQAILQEVYCGKHLLLCILSGLCSLCTLVVFVVCQVSRGFPLREERVAYIHCPRGRFGDVEVPMIYRSNMFCSPI
jgi:hypothetical protein